MKTISISKEMINPNAIEVCKILNEYGHQAFIVGGCVRDLMLGTIPKDWDITTDAAPQKVIDIFKKTYPTGIQHGTITVAMNNEHFEVTTFRIEGEYVDGRHPEEVFFVMNVKEDLSRRDLTINSMAYDPINSILIDPFGGIDDLKNDVIKAVGNPNSRFKEDGLRIMRTARFASRFSYEIETNTLQAMKDNVHVLQKVSKERIKDELCKILSTKYATYGLQILEYTEALQIACPMIKEIEEYEYSGELTTRLAILYSKFSAKQVQEELVNLKFSSKEIKQTCFLIDLIDKYNIANSKNTALAYKSFIATIKNFSPEPWEQCLNQFIILTNSIGSPCKPFIDKYKEEIVFSRREMSINGNDLIADGITSGPQIKSILESCYLEILKNPSINNKEILLEFINEL